MMSVRTHYACVIVMLHNVWSTIKMNIITILLALPTNVAYVNKRVSSIV